MSPKRPGETPTEPRSGRFLEPETTFKSACLAKALGVSKLSSKRFLEKAILASTCFTSQEKLYI